MIQKQLVGSGKKKGEKREREAQSVEGKERAENRTKAQGGLCGIGDRNQGAEVKE